MINTTVENVIQYEVYYLKDGKTLHRTQKRLEAYMCYWRAIDNLGKVFGLRKVTINTETEILEGEN